MRIIVGQWYENLEPESPLEKVIAIFESTVFLVCTPQRGGEKGMPYFFHRQDVQKVEYEECS